jgi:hypothetical protein
MRITRHLMMVATAAVVATSISGIFGSSAVSAAPSAQPALVWLEGELNDNGGALFFAPFPPFPPAVDWGLTIDAIFALNAGGRGSQPAASAATANLAAHINDYITGEAFGDPGSAYAGPIGKSMLAATLQGADVHHFGGVDLEALSRAALQPSGIHQGRFSDVSTFGDFSNGFGEALNILALARTPGGVPSDAADFLLAQQCPGGGFRLFYDNAPVTRGCQTDTEADTDTTAFSLQALMALDPGPTTSSAIDRAASWLVGRQDPVTGGFGGAGPTANVNANTSGLVAQALTAAGFVGPAASARTYVGSLQLDAAHTSGTPAAGDEGAIALDQGTFDDALVNGVTAATRAQWQRSTAQAVLAFGLTPLVVPRSDVVTVTPARLLDTRPGASTVDGKQSGGGLVPAGSTLVLTVAGRGGVPSNAAAAVLNVTAEGAAGTGFITVYPCGTTRPLASSLNFNVDTTIANQAVTGLAADGTVCVFVGTRAVNLIADVGGYFPAASGYRALTPARLLDTRPGEATVDSSAAGTGLIAPGSTVELKVAGRGGIPADAEAVVMNLTTEGAEGSGFVTAYPCDPGRPLASNLNFETAAPLANSVITKLSARGTVCLYVGTNGVNLIADVAGYFPTGSGYHALTPARLVDTRAGQSTIDGTQAGVGTTAAGSTLVVSIAGRGGVPAGATSVVLNITADGAPGPGFVTAYPCDSALPLASNVNFAANTSVPNAAITALAADGTVCLYVGTNSVDLIVDVSGYFG